MNKIRLGVSTCLMGEPVRYNGQHKHDRFLTETLGQYVDYFGDGNLGITGSLENISVLTTGLGIYFQKQATDGDNYLVDHSAAVLVIDPGGRFSGLFSGPHSVQNFVHDLPIIINGK